MQSSIPNSILGYQRVPDSDSVYVDPAKLTRFCSDVFQSLHVPESEAIIAADVLVQADLRGVDSHGVAHMNLDSFYLSGLLEGSINPQPKPAIRHETPSTALMDGDNGMGLIVGYHAMADAIARAEHVGSGWVAVHNTHHYGMAAYFAMMALPHNMIGISMTNAGPQMIPTFGSQPMIGTNPIAIAVPAHKEPDFVLDMATTVVAGGKFEIASRLGLQIPDSWGQDSSGRPTTDPNVANAARRYMPLGIDRTNGSHKGYGLGASVDILTGVLSSAGPSFLLPKGYCGHFFGAIRVDGFSTVEDFKDRMDQFLIGLKNTPPEQGHDRVYVAGEIEHEVKLVRSRHGIPLDQEVIERLRKISGRFEIPYEIELG